MTVISRYKKLSFSDFVRKSFFVFARLLSFKILRKIKALYYFKSSSLVLGKGIRVSGLSHDIAIGDQTIFYDNCIFEFREGSRLSIGTNVLFSYGVLLSCSERITIGNDVQVGEYTSIRDATHQYSDLSYPMKYQKDICKEVYIGNDVWIGRGCLISPGTVISDGVVVAANSVVKGYLEKNGIYGGTPVKLIKYRDA